jgi:hypothetical protein
MSQQYKQTLLPFQMKLVGNWTVGSDLENTIQLLPGNQGQVVMKFALPRNIIPGRGTRLTSIKVCYDLAAGNLTQLLPSLEEHICAPLAQPIVSVLSIANTDFQVFQGTVYNGISTVNSPSFDNDTRCEYFIYTLDMSAGFPAGASIEIHCVEVLFDWIF